MAFVKCLAERTVIEIADMMLVEWGESNLWGCLFKTSINDVPDEKSS